MSDRARLLALLIDEDVITILKADLTPRQRADLVLELINPHARLPADRRAALAGVTQSALRKRKNAKTEGLKIP